MLEAEPMYVTAMDRIHVQEHKYIWDDPPCL